MKHYFLKDKKGNRLGFKALESQVYDNNGECLSSKLERVSCGIKFKEDGYYNIKIDGTEEKVGDFPSVVVTNATQEKDGIMSYSDKLKIDGIAAQANKITFRSKSTFNGGESVNTILTNISTTGKKDIDIKAPFGFLVTIYNDTDHTFTFNIKEGTLFTPPEGYTIDGFAYAAMLSKGEQFEFYTRYEKIKITTSEEQENGDVYTLNAEFELNKPWTFIVPDSTKTGYSTKKLN